MNIKTCPISEATMPLVLLVEDNLMNRKLMRDILEIRFKVLEAERAEDALMIMKNSKPDLVMTDVQLPGMDGLALTRCLKGNPDTRAIPVVAVSAHAMQRNIDDALAAGCVAYVTKPLVEDPFVFVDRLRQFIHWTD